MMEKSYVTMEQKVCPICGRMRLIKKFDRHTVTGYGHCEECQKMINEDRIALVEVKNQGEGETLKQENAERTGQLVWMRREAFKNVFDIKAPSIPMVFIQIGVVEKLKEMMPNE